MLSPPLDTKLQPPSAAIRLRRDRLRAQLDGALDGGARLLLLVAPAGYGKTLLLSEWLDGRDDVAWLSIEESENDPLHFWRYVIAALQRVEPAWGASALPLLDVTPIVALDALVERLLHDLAAAPRPSAILVLDDYHLIQSAAVHDSLHLFLTHLPPAFRLVLAARGDPPLALARLRAEGALREWRASDLRFSDEEARALLNDAHGLALSPEALAALTAHTEGWAAGLQLAALSLRSRSPEEVAAFLDSFDGTHRYVLEYLVEEVLARQPAPVQQFLMRSAILQRLNGALCDHVLGADEGARPSEQMLRDLERAGLFTLRLDGAGQWYRYHHLFAELLVARLEEVAPGQAMALHRRASEWYAARGRLDEAARHALAGGAWEEAAAIIERGAEAIWGSGHLGRLAGWLERLPEAQIAARPRLGLVAGWLHFLRDHYPEAERRWEAVERLLAAEPNEAYLRAVLAAMRGALSAMRQEAERTIALAAEALRHLPPEATTWRAVVTIDLGLAHAARGEVGAAARHFEGALALCEESHNSYLAFVALWHLAEAQLLAGRLREAERAYGRMERLDEHEALHPLVLPGYAAIGRAGLAVERDELERAAQQLDFGLGQLPADAQPRCLLYGWLVRARLRQARGEGEGAGEALGAAAAIVEREGLAPERALVAAHGALLALRAGRLAEARDWAADSGLNPAGAADPRREVEQLTLARVLLAEGDAAEARALVERLMTDAEGAARQGALIEQLVVHALALAAEGEGSAALASLRRALRLAEPEEYRRLFLDEGAALRALLQQLAEQERHGYARALVTAAPERGPAPSLAAALAADPLTPRESEVLALMARGLSNQQIAATLVIGLGTVKGHINHILAKLAAQNRTEAVLHAMALGLIDSP